MARRAGRTPRRAPRRPLEGEDWRRWGRPSPVGDSQLYLAINRIARTSA